MPTFRYRAMDGAGKIVTGLMEGPNASAVAGRLSQQGQVPLSADPVSETGLARLLHAPLALGRRVSLKDLQLLTRELAVLLKAGVALEEAFSLVIGVTRNVTLRKALEEAASDLREGASLAKALGKHEALFDGYYCSMVRAGEQSGRLEETFDGLARFLEQRVAITESITSALIYPMILAVLVVMTLVLVVAVVLPEFKPIFDDLGSALPIPTRIAMAVGTLFQDYWWLLVILLVAAAVAVHLALGNPETRARIDRALLRLPIAGMLIRKAETGRFTRTLGALLKGGLPLPHALALAVGGVRNRAISATLAETVPAVREGGGLTMALQRTATLPDLALRLIRIGEQSGRLEQMLLEVADLFDTDVKRGLDRAMAAMVPVITIVMGLIIGGLIASVLLGIMSVNQLAVS